VQGVASSHGRRRAACTHRCRGALQAGTRAGGATRSAGCASYRRGAAEIPEGGLSDEPPQQDAAGVSNICKALPIFILSGSFQGEEPLDTGGGRVFSRDASFGLLATASASALALFLTALHSTLVV